jgi:hypothetical protein
MKPKHHGTVWLGNFGDRSCRGPFASGQRTRPGDGWRPSAGHTNDRWRTQLLYEAFSQVNRVTLPVYGPM